MELRLLVAPDDAGTGCGEGDALGEGREVAEEDKDAGEHGDRQEPGPAPPANEHRQRDGEGEVQNGQPDERNGHPYRKAEIPAVAAFHPLRCRP